MNDQPSNHQEDRVMKILAIIGFIVAVLVLAWLAIQVIRFIPNAFSSLASIADRVYNRGDDSKLVIVLSDNVVNSKAPITVRWSDLGAEGTYQFSYACVPGVSLEVRENDEMVPLSCEDAYTVPAETFSLDMIFASERERFVDIPVSVFFTPEGGSEDIVADHELTVVNMSIPLQNGGVSEEVPEEEPEEDDTPTPSLPYTGYDPEETGYADLSVSYKDVGVLESGVFMEKNVLSPEDTGAFRFSVTNIGTKTSGAWTFDATLASGTGYTSEKQDVLAPNETIIVTVAFDNFEDHGLQQFGATVKGGNDNGTVNNSFTRSVAVSK